MPEEIDPPDPSEGDAEWWPGYPDINAMYRRPAFTVQRDILGYVEGGDYVRGSTDADLQQTALRYRTGLDETAFAEAAQRGVLYTRAFDYNTVEIFWGIPGKVFDKWAEMAIVRSAFGHPETVNDGQTIFREYQATLFPVETFPEGMPDNWTFEPIYDVRNPATGGTPKLTSGRFYYYSLFFRINFQWIRSMTAATLLPRNHHHAEHLWDTLTPYYRWVDNQQREGDGDLQRFLRVFGFELDTIREFVENWQELYHIDFSPVPLLRRLGPTFGLPYESGIGDIRYRALVAELGLLYGIRGTRPCLEKVCEAVSKFECDVTQTGNLMTLPDDSDFFEGTGNWAGHNPAYPVTNIIPTATVLAPNKVLYKSTRLVAPPPAYGRAVMEVWSAEADETTDILLTCGSGIAYDVYAGKDPNGQDNPYGPRYIYPIQVGILVDEEGVYSFSAQVKMEVPGPVSLMLLWYDTDGGVMDYLGKSTASDVGAPPAGSWKGYQCLGTAPAGAVYAVPAIYLETRVGSGTISGKSPSVYVAAAAVYNFGSAERVSSEGPNPYLEMGNIMKRLGLPIAVPPAPDAGQPPLPAPYPGYQIGGKK